MNQIDVFKCIACPSCEGTGYINNCTEEGKLCKDCGGEGSLVIAEFINDLKSRNEKLLEALNVISNCTSWKLSTPKESLFRVTNIANVALKE